jgi:hypothetical protein
VPLPTLEFTLLRAETEGLTVDSTKVVVASGITKFFYVDINPRLLSFYNGVYYQVYTDFGGKRYHSQVKGPTYDLRADEVARKRKMLYDEEIVLKKFSGRKLAILKRRHIGDRCDHCWDPNTMTVTSSNCRYCYSTGFKDPYYDPFITYGARLPEQKEVDEIGHDHGNEVDYTKYQILDYPTVTPQDLVVDLESNDRYKVDRIEQTEIRRFTVHQELVTTKLSRTSVEYKYPIQNDLFGLPLSV